MGGKACLAFEVYAASVTFRPESLAVAMHDRYAEALQAAFRRAGKSQKEMMHA